MYRILIVLVLLFLVASCTSSELELTTDAELNRKINSIETIAILEKGTVVTLENRTGTRCEISVPGTRGWTYCELIENVPTEQQFMASRESPATLNDISDGLGFILGMVMVIAIIILVLWLLVSWADKKQKRIKDAAIQYQKALTLLRESPDDTVLRQEALRLGRRYADLARGYKRYTFDEVALMNDLNAIPTTKSTIVVEVEGATDNTEESTGIVEESTGNTEERLTKLKQLHSKGLIADEEYNERRRAILDEI